MTTPEPTPRDEGLVHTITELINEHDDFPTDDLCARIIAAVRAHDAVRAAPDAATVERVMRAIWETGDGDVSGVPFASNVLRPGTIRRGKLRREAIAALNACLPSAGEQP